MDSYTGRVIALIFVIGVFATYILIIQKPLYVDEYAHFFTVSNFCRFDYSFPGFLTTIPGYHFFAGLFGYLTICTENSIRFFNVLVSLASIFVFYNICRQLGIKESKEKLLQLGLLPILFPFFFLIYTDVLSLLFVLSMFYFCLKENYLLSAIFGILSFVVRQNNVIWVVFTVAYILLENKGSLTEKIREFFKKESIKKTYPYLILFILAGIFIIKNGGFAVGDKDKHPLFFGPMNIYTLLFFFFWINLPENIVNIRKIGSWLKDMNRRDLGFLVIISVLFFSFFILTFKIDHPYNDYGIYNYFLRNKILHFFDSSLILKSVFFLCVLYSILSLNQVKLRERKQYSVYLFSIIFLGMSWLIENRYFIIPYVLINLFAMRENRTEKYLVVWYLLGIIIYMCLFYTSWTFW